LRHGKDPGTGSLLSPRRQRRFALVVSALIVVGAGLGGCALVPFKARKGVYHKVRKGETLWRICYTYQVNMKKVCRANRIKDPGHVVVGQEVFIPGAKWVRKVNAAPTQTASRAASEKKQSAPAAKPAPPKTSPSPAKLSFIWPVKGPVTSWFGPRKGRPHDGIDISAPKGTPIRAAEKGKVIYSDNGISGYGNLIIIQHSGGFHTVYGHNLRNRVDVDEWVNKWQVIGEVGNTGRASGYHLHFEMRKNERAVDPMDYLP
jgi:murein DD-endopeptidase MepM/ murein hydrolase activator NlpD